MENVNETKPATDSEIKTDLVRELAQAGQEGKSETQNPIIEEDFLPNDVVRLLVASKNGAAATYLSKNLHKGAKEIVTDAYKPTDREVELYKRGLQNFIRKNFPHWIELIKRFVDQDLVALIAFEGARLMALQKVLHEGAPKESRDKVTA